MDGIEVEGRGQDGDLGEGARDGAGDPGGGDVAEVVEGLAAEAGAEDL
ncbi:MAG: hypothetical protein K2W96_10445 [Gemmataceae bacterium]|nr:hypothetical protein [Gemmataceae bacterium]